MGGLSATRDLLGELLRPRPAVERAYSVGDIRRLAMRRVPRMTFDYIDGGAEDEVTLRRNTEAIEEVTFVPRSLIAVPDRDLGTTVFGERIELPVVLGPTGMPALHHPGGEIAAGRAAAAAGTSIAVSTASSYAVGEVAARIGRTPWFQLYMASDRGLTEALLEQAEAAGCRVLLVTVDTPIAGSRERDLRNGYTLPPRITRENSGDALRHPLRVAGWGLRFRSGPGIGVGTLEAAGARTEYISSVFNPEQAWSELEWLRTRWPGPIAVKGVMTAADGRRVAERGLDGLVVSNHGGRQLDGLPATIEVLPEIADAVHDAGVTVLIDSGIRRGGHVARALALGADACLVARPWTWGLAAGGEAGVARVLELMAAELDRTLTLLGAASVDELDRSFVSQAAVGAPATAALPS
jgi:isopentenyl diphosphate isomerase/L-lactate dehydrogenase-like FMN-dependent dehydrogenase